MGGRETPSIDESEAILRLAAAQPCSCEVDELRCPSCHARHLVDEHDDDGFLALQLLWKLRPRHVKPAILATRHVAGEVDPWGGLQQCARCGDLLCQHRGKKAPLWFGRGDIVVEVSGPRPSLMTTLNERLARASVECIAPVL